MSIVKVTKKKITKTVEKIHLVSDETKKDVDVDELSNLFSNTVGLLSKMKESPIAVSKDPCIVPIENPIIETHYEIEEVEVYEKVEFQQIPKNFCK